MSTDFAPWRQISRPAIGYDDSSELIQRAVVLQINENIADQIELQQLQGTARDADFYEQRGLPYTTITLKPLNPKSVYVGHRVSLQDAPQNTFPAVTVRCLNTVPSGDAAQADQYDSNDLTLIVEIWVSTGPYKDPVANQADSEEIDRVLHRFASAVRGCISMDKTLGNTEMGIQRPPRTVASLPFVRKATESNTGPKFLVQALELTYTVTSLSF